MKIFGTDGIRGKAGLGFITPEFIIKIPSAIAKIGNTTTKRVIIGKDTRISCYSIESALVAGFTANGFEVILTGPIPTPAVSMLVKSLRADYGIMISASHNEYSDNGVKIFGSNGVKSLLFFLSRLGSFNLGFSKLSIEGCLLSFLIDILDPLWRLYCKKLSASLRMAPGDLN